MRETTQGQTSRGGAEREGERILSRLHTIRAEPDVEPNPMNCEIMTLAEIKSQTLNLLSHPGAPGRIYIF